MPLRFQGDLLSGPLRAIWEFEGHRNILKPPPADQARPTHNIIGASDAGARPTEHSHEAIVGGWYGPNTPHKHDKHWFYIKLDPTRHPWAFEKGNPQLHIASMELYGTLLLYKAITAQQNNHDISLDVSLNTDNRGNAYEATDQKTKNDTAANMLMELALLQHRRRCRL